ncbi:hypothetical protein ACH5A3_12865 [Streptomyces echinatus]|uniref:hypothetical protein n=1 Tax=Streptomyces echinatus TaxID=67293 RepID=UPI0037B1A049
MHLKLTDHRPGTDRTVRDTMDLALDRDGNCVGELVLKADGGTVEIIKRGDQMWMKRDTAHWKAQLPGERGETAARLFEDRYIHGSTRDRVLEGPADACDLAALQKEVAARSSTGGSVTRGEETERGKGTDRTAALTDYDEPVPSAKESVDVSRLDQLLRAG